MNDEEIVQAALNDLASKRAEQEENDYNFFFQAPDDVQLSYYKFWIHAHSDHDVPMPRFLIDYEKDTILSQKS